MYSTTYSSINIRNMSLWWYEFKFILAVSNLTLEQSIFIKQIISALALDPQNNFCSTGSGALVKTEVSNLLSKTICVVK